MNGIDNDLDRRALQIMEEVMDLPEAQQAQALDERCRGEEPLKQRVMALLARDREATAGTDRGLAGIEHASFPESAGPYRLLRRLGEGGMGAVYLAQRADGVYERQVAVKFVRAGHRAAAAQFAVERQILAGLKHPNIAQLLDGGEENGQPYLVMEYIEGVPINEYAAGAGIELHEVLQLFIQVATAAHYAHGRLIVHRDIKPGNVLVTADRQVKLLDFGIAKLYQSQQDAELQPIESALTCAGLTPITPDYASPEQLAGELATPASDVYALGVLMYETLTGERPYKLAGRSLPEAHRVLQETGELPPSLATGTRRTPTGAETLPGFSQMQLRGDLDRIVMKAMHRDPARRYASAAHLADDLQRLLDGEAVLAHGDDWFYLTRKFVARHRAGIIAATVAVAALAAGLVVTSTLYVEAERARGQADLRFDQLRSLARSMMFDVYDELDKVPGSTSARQQLVANVQNYLEALSDARQAPPEVKLDAAQGYVRLYEIFNRQAVASEDDRNKAAVAGEKAQRLLEGLIAADPDSPMAHRVLGDLFSERADETLYTSNRPQQARAEILRAIEAYDHARRLQPHDLDLAARRFRAQRILADSHKWQDEFDLAIRQLTVLLEEIASVQNTAPGNEALMRVRADSLFLRGESHYFAEHAAPAEADFRQSLAWYEKLRSSSGQNRSVDDASMIAYWSLGNLQYENEDWQEALDNYDAAVKLVQPQVIRDPTDANAMRRLRIFSATKAKALSQVDRLDEAMRLMDEGNRWFEQRAERDRSTPVALREVALSYDTTADILEIGHRAGEACEWRRRTLDIWQQIDARWGISDFDKQEPDRLKNLLADCR